MGDFPRKKNDYLGLAIFLPQAITGIALLKRRVISDAISSTDACSEHN